MTTLTYGTFALTALLAASPASPPQDRRPADRARIDTTFAFENTGAVTLSLIALVPSSLTLRRVGGALHVVAMTAPEWCGRRVRTLCSPSFRVR